MANLNDNMSSTSLEVEVSSPKKIVKDRDPLKYLEEIELMKPPHAVRKILHKVNTESSVLYYTEGKSVNELNAIDVTSIPNGYVNRIDSLEELPVTRHRKECQPGINRVYRKINPSEKTTVSSRRNLNLPKRVWVKDPDDMQFPSTIFDTDSEFHTFVLGRPTTTERFNLKRYLADQRDSLRTRIFAGIYDDETDIVRRITEVKRVFARYRNNEARQYRRAYMRYMNEEFDINMRWLDIVDESEAYVKIYEIAYQKLMCLNERISDRTLNAEWRWRTLRLYQKFLYFVSPMPWRLKYDFIHRKELLCGREARLTTVFRKYILTEQGYIPPLEVLVDEYLANLEMEEEPVLFFTEPEEIFEVIRALEAQSLNCYRQAAAHSFVVERLAEAIDDYQAQSVVVRCIERNIRVLPMNEMVNRIEHHYHTLLIKLEHYPLAIVKEAEELGFEDYLEDVRALQWVIKELKKLDIVYKKVKRIADPPYHKKRDLVWRSYPGKEPPIIPYTPRVLTEDELIYLRGFTLWLDSYDVQSQGIDLALDETDLEQLIYEIKPGRD
ncbi:hypothetical protein CBL_13793 [Carabus blaptoides fortunei]